MPREKFFVTLWEDLIDFVIEEVKNGFTSFAFYGVKIKQFGKKVYLTTSSSTIITRVDAITISTRKRNQSEMKLPREEPFLVDEFVIVLNFCKFFICQGCDKKLSELQKVERITCPKCGGKQRVKNCERDVTINVEVSKWKREKLTMFGKTISKLLKSCDILTADPDTISDMLLDLKDITLKVDTLSKTIIDATVGEMADAGKQVETGDAVGGMAEILDM